MLLDSHYHVLHHGARLMRQLVEVEVHRFNMRYRNYF